ncbi:Ubiquitin-conjugating enzyme, E2 [Corchorus olitorius]|uniref:Ubiquitin-conjugating enzyme, E2 n=1 Tax=Corchorus olitorius TaxID=93759 RepID=A0A1R3IWF5_9ROSI|nr:Ubiquitin-conjugating enzyme, E2 [Corchorus olitorius]
MESKSSVLRDRALLGLEQFDCVTDFSDHRYRGNAELTNKETIERIMKEWKILKKNLPESIFVRVYENRVDLMRAAIMGAQGTPYHYGLFFFDISFPSNYPNSPPKVQCSSFKGVKEFQEIH